jgi:hypothetical protein
VESPDDITYPRLPGYLLRMGEDVTEATVGTTGKKTRSSEDIYARAVSSRRRSSLQNPSEICIYPPVSASLSHSGTLGISPRKTSSSLRRSGFSVSCLGKYCIILSVEGEIQRADRIPLCGIKVVRMSDQGGNPMGNLLLNDLLQEAQVRIQSSGNDPGVHGKGRSGRDLGDRSLGERLSRVPAIKEDLLLPNF